MTLTGILTIVLQVFGVLWAIGGAFVINEMRLALFVDKAIDQIELGVESIGVEAEDRGRTYWLLIGGVLTLLSGAGLMAASPYALIPLVILVAHQGLYAWRQYRLSRQALEKGNDDLAEEAEMSPAARKGAVTSVFVLCLAIFVFGGFWGAL